jgi:hypothetical protein
VSAVEKTVWWKVLALGWGVMLVYTFVMGLLGTHKGQTEGVVAMAWISAAFTVLYLLILSWRAAYLSGRGKR